MRALVALEVALSLTMLSAAGLMARSFYKLSAVDPGVRVAQVMTFAVTPPGRRYPSAEETVGFFHRLEEQLEGRPEITDVAFATDVSPGTPSSPSDLVEESWPPGKRATGILQRLVSPDYFRVMDVPLLRGRAFDEGDVVTSPAVVLVNETLARTAFPGEDAVGKRIGFSRPYWRTIVGVVADERQMGLSTTPRPEVFLPLYQAWDRNAVVVMRTRGRPDAALPVARGVLTELDPLIALERPRSMEQVVATDLARERFLLLLIAVFAAAAVLLATVGVYGVTAEASRGRTREIGIRLALGARASEVRDLVLRQGIEVVCAGLALGWGLALAGARLLESLLYEVAPTDPLTFLVVPVLLGGVALVACWLPARKATRVDPVEALRAD